MHDPKKYPNPQVFFPDRFFENSGTLSKNNDPSEIIFGFGRR